MKRIVAIVFAAQCWAGPNQSLVADGAADTVTWAKWLHGAGVLGIIPAGDGGVIVGHGLWLARFDADGAVVWDRTYTGLDVSSDIDVYPRSLRRTSGGGVVAAGSIRDPDRRSRFDAWVRKFDSDGNLEWTRLFGSALDEYAADAQQTADGGYVIAGRTKSSDGEDAFVIKLSASLEVEWQKAYGTTGYESAESIIQTTDGGFLVPALFVPASPGTYSALLLKLDSRGSIQWQTSLRSDQHAILRQVVQMPDGGCVAGGYIGVLGGVAGDLDPWVVRLDPAGKLLWQKAFGGPGHDLLYGIDALSTGEILLNGIYNPTPDSLDYKPWIAALNPATRTLSFQRSFTGWKPMTSVGAAVEATDGGFFVATTSCCGTSLMRLGPGPRLEDPCSPLMLKSAAKPARTKAKGFKTNLMARDLALSVETLSGGVKDAGTSVTNFCLYPDIIGSWQWVMRSDNTVKASLVCENIGTRSTSDGFDSGFRVQVYLSTDARLDVTDIHLKEIWVTTLRAGESSLPGGIVYKSSGPIAGQYLIAALDKSSATGSSAVFESDETNNLVVGVIP